MTITSNHSAQPSNTEPSFNRTSGESSSGAHSAPWSHRGSQPSTSEDEATSFTSVRTRTKLTNPRAIWLRLVDFYFSSSFRIALRGTLGYFILSLFVFVAPMYNDTYGPLAIEMFLLIVTFGLDELHFGFISQGAIQSTTSLVMAAGLGALGAYAGETSYGITLGVAIVVTFLFTLLHADTRIAFISSMGEMFFMFNLLDSRARGYKFILQYFYDTLIGAALSHAISLFTGIVVFPCLAKSEMRRNIKKCLQLAGTALTETASFALEPRVQYTEPFIQFTSAKLTTPTSDSVNKLTSIPENSSVTLSKGNEDNGASMQQALTKSIDPYVAGWLDKIPWDTYLLEKMVDGRVIDEASSALARAKKMLNAIGYEPNLWRPFHNESIKRWRSLMDAIDEMLRTIRGLQSIVDGERRRYRAETLEQWHAMLPGLREHFATLATMCMKMSGVIDELKCGRPGDWKAYVTTKWFWLMSCFTKKDNVTIDDSETTEAKQRKVIETLQSRLFSWSTILQKFRCSVQEAYKECFEKYQSPVADEAEAPLLVGMLTMEWGPLLFVVTSSKVLQDTIGAVQDEIIYLANEETRSSWGNFARNCFGWIPICFMMFEQYWKVIRNFPLTWRAWVALIYTSEFQFCLKKWLGEVLLLIVLLISPIHVLLTKYDGTWMWMSYILYIAPSVEGTLFGGLLTITGVGIGAGISFILTYFHYPARSPYILDTYLTLATAITVFNVNNPFSLSFVTFCFSSYVIILYQYSPNAYITNWHYAVSRFVMISLGAIIAVFLNEFVLPHSALMDARENLSAALRRENTLHSWYLQSFVSGRYKENVPGEPPLSPDNQTIDDDLDSAEELVKNQEAAFEADSNNEECNGDDKVEQPKLVRPKQKANQEKKQEYIGKIQTVALDAWKGSEEGEWAYAHFRSGRRRGSSFSDARSSFEQRQRGSSRESTISEPQNCNDEQDLNQTQMNGKSEQVVESRGEKTQESVKSEHSTDGDQSRERRPESVSSVKDRKQTVAKSHKAVNNEVEVRKLLEDTATILNSIQNGVGASVHAIPKAIWTALSQERLILDRLSAFHSILEYEPILVGKFQNSGLEDFLTETTEQMKAIVIARRTLVEIMVACLMDGHPFRSFQFFREFGWKSARNTISVAWFSADFAKRVTENTASFLGANVVGSAANVLGRHTSNLVHNLTGDKLSKDKSDREKEERVGNEYSYDVNDQEASRKHREMEIFASLMALSELNHFKDTAFSGASHIKKFLQSAFTSAEKQVVEVPRSLYSWIRIAGSNVAHLAFHSQRDSQADHKSLETQNTNTSKILHETGNQNDQSTSQIEVTAEPTATLQDSTVSVEPTLSLPVDQVLDNLNALSPTTPWSFWEDLDAPSETRPDQTLPGSEERISSSRQVSYPIDSVRETVNGTEININSNSDNADSNKDKDSVSSPGARRILSGLSSRSRRTLTSPRSEKVQTISERVTEKRESAAQIRKKRNFTDIFGKLEKGLSTGVKQVGTAGGSMFHSVVHNILEGDSTEEPPVIVNLKDACKALRHAQGQLYIQYLDWVQKHQKEIIYSYGDSVSRETTNFATDPRFQNADDLLQWYALFFAAFYVLDGFQQMCRSLIDAIHEDIEVLREEHRLAVEKQVQKKKAKDLDSIRRRRRKRRKRTQNEKT